MTTNTHIAAQLRAISEWLASQVNMGQNSYDEPPQPATEFDQRLDQAACEISQCAQALEAAPALDAQGEAAWEGGEGWESLAWELCADEHGEEACNELIWEGGPIPEPWGDRWMKYEDEAKRLIALVHKHVPPPPPALGKPLSEAQKGELWYRAHRDESRRAAFAWYFKGIADAERAHGIVTKETGNGDQG